MPQHDYDLANQSRTAFRADLNNALLAIVSQNSGATAPATTFAYQWWADTTTGLLKQRNAANTAWITIGTLADAYWGLTPQADLQKQTYKGFTTGGTATAFTLTPTPASTGNVAGQEFDITFNAAAGSTPTLSVSSQTALNLKYRDSTGAKQAITSTQVPSGWRSKVYCDGTDWVVREIPAASAISAGQIIRSTQTVKTDTFSTTSTTLTAITGLSVTTPVDAARTTADKVNVRVRIQAGSGGDEAIYALFRGATQIFMGDAAGSRTRVSAGLGSTGTGVVNTVAFDFKDSPGTTGQTTYSVQVLVRSGTTYVNRSATDTDGATWGRMASTITAEEEKG